MDISIKAFFLATGMVLLAALMTLVLGGNLHSYLSGILAYFVARLLLLQKS